MPATDDKGPMIDRDKYKYDTTRVADPKTGKVRAAISNGDAVARAMMLIARDVDTIAKLARKNGLAELAEKHKNATNAGLFRMTIGNALRGLVRKGTEVTIGDVVVKKLDQREPVVKDAPKVERAPKAPAAKKSKGSKTRAAVVA